MGFCILLKYIIVQLCSYVYLLGMFAFSTV